MSGTAVRSCTVPTGTSLLFPVVNASYISTSPPNDEAFLRSQVDPVMDGASNLKADIDGVSVPDILSHREESTIFNVNLPDGNIFGVPAGTYGPSADAGYYLMTTPLSVGKHIIHFHGTVPPFGPNPEFTLDITYHITVSPGA